MYEEAMKDPELSVYLPSMEQNSNKLPERSFFFGVLSTLKGDYLKGVIAEAHKVRMHGDDEEEKKNNI
jgi:hypothetical protein